MAGERRWVGLPNWASCSSRRRGPVELMMQTEEVKVEGVS